MKFFRIVIVGSCTLIVGIAAAGASPNVWGASTPGALQVVTADDIVLEMPLRHTRVSVEISAFVARVKVEQTFANPFDVPVEAIYTFPLGDEAAVDDFELTSGSTTIRGEIRTREEARQEYESARDEGRVAALLEQERPNIFTQNVANLMPGHEVKVRLRTVEVLDYTAGVYEFLFPLVVGQRYIPGEDTDSQTAVVADADRITQRFLTPELRSGHDVSIEVELDAGVPVQTLRSPSHRIETMQADVSHATVRLAPDDTIPNKDFILRWDVSAEQPTVGLLCHRDAVDGYFALLVQPKGEIDVHEAAPKEIILVMDTSGSMGGIPMEMSKRFAEQALRTLGPRDTFNLIRFAGNASVFSRKSRANDPAEVEQALKWIEQLEGEGGTEMLKGFRAAFAGPVDPDRMRMVVFLTDGQIGDEQRILAAIKNVVGDSRIFTLGIGSAVNHSLLDRMAELGRGAYESIPAGKETASAVDRFRSWVTRPYLTDLEVDWGALPVLDTIPERPGDLFSGQTLQMVGRYAGGGDGEITVRGRLGGRYWEQSVSVVLPEYDTRSAALPSIWARRRVDDLMLSAPGNVSEETREEVTRLGLDFRLMTPFTSFVAVDYSNIANPAGQWAEFHQPVPVPEGTGLNGGVITERETVVATRSVVDVTSSNSSTLFASNYVQDLPVQGRFYTNVMTLAPGVQDADGDGIPNVHGARERDLATTVGGLSTLDPVTGMPLSHVNLDSLEEVEVITAGAGVEYGRAQGGFANVIEKQGNNGTEGTFQLLWGSSALDGDGAASLDGDPPHFGKIHASFQISGPMVRDKLWYSLSHSYLSQEDPINVVNDIVVTGLSGEIHTDRITWQMSPRNKLAFRFASYPLTRTQVEVSSLIGPDSSSTLERDDRSFAVIWTAPYSPRILVETTIGYQELELNLRPSVIGSPNHCVESSEPLLATAWCFDTLAGPITGSATRLRDDSLEQFSLANRIHLFGGRFWGMTHQFKLGAGVENGRYRRHLVRNPSLFRLYSKNLGDATLLGRFALSPSTAGSNGTFWSLYFEDQMKPVSNVVVTLGGRVDGGQIDFIGRSAPEDTAPSRSPENVTIANVDFSPFLGVSWDPWKTGKTKLAFSVRRYYAPISLATPLVEMDPDTVDIEMGALGEALRPVETLPVNTQVVDRDLRTPNQDELTVSFERELAAETSLRLSYIRRSLHDQLQQIDISPGPGDGDSPWGDVFLLGNFDSAEYRAWVIELVRRQYRNWQMWASYTFSDAEGDGEEFDPVGGDEQTLLVDRPGYQSNDRRHVAKLFASTIVPLLGGFRLGGAFTWESGLPYSILKYEILDAPTPSRPRLVYVTGARNDRRNPSYWNVDFKIAKEFNANHGLNLEVSLEIFNLFNDDTEAVYNGGLGYGRRINGFREAARRFGRQFRVGLVIAF